MNAEVPAICQNILGAVLNGMAQGVLPVLLLAAAFRVFRKMNAATRHGLELITLAILLALPFAHFHVLPFDSSDFFTSPASLPAPAEESLRSVPSMGAPPNIFSSPEPAKFFWNISLSSYVSVAILSLWAMIAVVRLGFLASQLFTLRRWKRDGMNAPDAVRELFSKLCVELKVSRAPQLRVAEKISVPMAVGFKEPAVLLPANLCGTVSDVRLEQILRHELAHVVRRDDWANLFQQVTRALFFFHPGVVWTSRRMTIDREIACDDHVLSAFTDRKAYALSLAELACKQPRNVIAAPAAWGNHSQLKQRINMILDTKRNSSPRLARAKTSLFAGAAILVAALAFQVAPRLAFAQGAAETPPAEPAALAEPAAPATVSVNAEPLTPLPAEPSTTIVAPRPPHAPRRARAAAALSAPTPAIAGVPGGGVLFAGAPPAEDDDSGPKVKARAGGRNDDLERRMERLERVVESLRRDNEKKDFQFEFQNKFNPPDFNWNGDEFGKMHEKIAKDADKAARDAMKQAQKVKGSQGGYQAFGQLGEGLDGQRKTLEDQKEELEQQLRSLEKQIQNLEKARQKLEQERERGEARAEREKRRAEEKARHDKEENGEEKEKDKQ
jgi:beta-lactamase regulating signal transducer with metallopeptidase domain